MVLHKTTTAAVASVVKLIAISNHKPAVRAIPRSIDQVYDTIALCKAHHCYCDEQCNMFFALGHHYWAANILHYFLVVAIHKFVN
jgi:hypothetical protein